MEKSSFTTSVDSEAEKTAVRAVLNQFKQALETKNLELLSTVYSHDTDMVNIGTDASERIVGWEALNALLEKQNAACENTTLTVRDQVIHVNPAGDTAWFSEVIDWSLVAEGTPVHLDGLRFTGVLEKRNGNWVLVQSHLSAPVLE